MMNQLRQLPVPKTLEPLYWLIGTWQTNNPGNGKFLTIETFSYHEEIEFFSIGQPMLNYVAQSWHPESKKPMHREVGFLKIKPNTNELSFYVSHNFGLTTIEEGEVTNEEIKLISTNIARNEKMSKPPAVIQVFKSIYFWNDE